MFPYIVADVGGTNARFGLVTGKDTTAAGFAIDERRSLNAADFDSFEDCLQAYLTSLGGIRPVSACIAIAGPISGDRVSMTNRNWQFSRSGLRQRLQLDRSEADNQLAPQSRPFLICKEDVSDQGSLDLVIAALKQHLTA